MNISYMITCINWQLVLVAEIMGSNKERIIGEVSEREQYMDVIWDLLCWRAVVVWPLCS